MKLSHIPAALDAVRARGEYRTISDLRMESAARGTGRDGTARLVFHSNDYLGMTHEPAVVAAAREALRWGTGSGGARLTSGASFELSDLEAELARFKGYEAALVFNTGYMTNLGVLYGLADKRDVIFSDSLNHASLIDGCRISRASVAVYPHSDMDALRRLLRDTPCEGERFIITDGVFSMDGDVADLPALAELAHTYHARLLVDDAHATGVIGETGRGTAEYWHLPGVIDLQVGTLSKALGSEGGFLCASRPVVEWLRNRSRPFIFSTAIGPATAAAALAALRLLEADPAHYLGRLRRNTALLRDALIEAGLPLLAGHTPILPLVMGDPVKTAAFADRCRAEGLLLSAIRPPSVPEGTSRIRLTVTAAHSTDDIDRAADILIRTWRALS